MTEENKQDLVETNTGPEDEMPTAESVGQPDPTATPDLSSAFGEDVQVEVNSKQFSVLVMCWNLAAQNVLGDRRLVNIQTDDEALDILRNEGIPEPVKNADGLWQTGMGFQHETNGAIVSRFQIADDYLPLLAVRALHVKYVRWDPELAMVINKFFQVQAIQQAKDLAGQAKH
jgi:hypothetical protein